ncbi:MAG: hypothetical protein R3D33_12220 [Hyphomicrobiaceae bacterium]
MRLAGHWRNIWLAAIAVAGSAAAYLITSSPRPPTVDEYLAHQGLDRSALIGTQITIGGREESCGDRPIIHDPTLTDVAAAHPGYLIFNPKRVASLPAVVQLYAFGHECGHQIEGRSEEKADCYAIRLGRAEGWLDPAGIEAICDFWKPYAGDSVHLPGKARCDLMKRCYAEAASSGG